MVDFGIGIGKRQCFLYNLPETASCHVNLRVPSVSARFGTAPWFWNVAMWLTARLAPKGATVWLCLACRWYPTLYSAGVQRALGILQ